MSAAHLEYQVPPGAIVLRLSGRVSSAKMVRPLEAVRRYPQSMPLLADGRLMAIPTQWVIEDVARRLASHPYDPAIRLAILVTPDWYAIGPMVAHYFPGPRTHAVHVCQSWQDAAQALGFSAGELPEASSGSR